MKKAALGLTLLLTMSTAIACAPADEDQGAAGDPTFRGARQYQEGTQQFGARGAGNLRGGGVLGGTGNHRQGMYNERGALGTTRGGIAGGARAAPDGVVIRDDGMLARDGVTRGTGAGLFGRDITNRDTDGGLFGRDNDGGLFDGGGLFGGDTTRRGGGLLNGGAGTRMNGTRDAQDTGIGGQRVGTQDRDRELERQVIGIAGVSDVIVVRHGNDIIVGVETEGRNDTVIQQVRQQIQGDARGQQVHINILNDENEGQQQNQGQQQNNR